MSRDDIGVMSALREKLRSHIVYEDGESIRKQLKAYADEHYERQNTAEEYIQFMNGNACTFRVNHAQAENFPCYWTMFSEKSQHVQGDCIEECLDKAIAKRN